MRNSQIILSAYDSAWRSQMLENEEKYRYSPKSRSGEMVRIRVPSFVIGRAEGNLVIPHDGGMSGRHAEIGEEGGG